MVSETHATSIIKYRLYGTFDSLTAWIGLDDGSFFGKGVKYFVIYDSDTVYASEILYRDDNLVYMSAPVKDVDQMTLVALGWRADDWRSCAYVEPKLQESSTACYIRGTITNSSTNIPIANVKIEFTSPKYSGVVYSSSEGTYEIIGQFGEYTLEISHAHFQGKNIRKITVATKEHTLNLSYNPSLKKNKVALVVDRDVYPEIADEINTYITDVEKDFPVQFLLYTTYPLNPKSDFDPSDIHCTSFRFKQD